VNGGPDLTLAALRMLGALALLAASLVGLLYLARRFGAPGGAGAEIRVLASRPLGSRERIVLVAIPDAVLVLGVTRERIQLLERIGDPERIGELGRKPDPPDFARAFRRAMGRKGPGDPTA
jgi:flagellar protein FliO/FliZ